MDEGDNFEEEDDDKAIEDETYSDNWNWDRERNLRRELKRKKFLHNGISLSGKRLGECPCDDILDEDFYLSQ